MVGEKDIQSAWVIEDLIFNPSLKILRTFGTAWYGEELSCFKWPTHKNCNLEYLDLMETYIDAEGLKTVLTRCPNLTGIAIRLPGEYRKLLDQYETEDSENADCIINLDDFGEFFEDLVKISKRSISTLSFMTAIAQTIYVEARFQE